MPSTTPRASCIECGTTEGMDWWLHHRSASGSQRCRCRDCFYAYNRSKPSYLARMVGELPKPCVDCGEPFTSYHNANTRCQTCSDEFRKTYRTASEIRRRNAYAAGDSGIHWLPLGERDGWICHICNKRVKRVAGNAVAMDGATVDHLVPISDDGEHRWHNVALAHRSCNLSRRAGGVAQLRLEVA